MDRPKLSLRKRLLFASVPVVALLVVAEIVLRLGPDQHWLAGDRLWEHWYARQRWQQEAAAADNPAATPTAADLDEHDPLLGWRPRAGFRSAFINTNSRGLRGLAEHTDPKPTGTLRVLTVGNSFTFGEGVADHETFAHRLGERLRSERPTAEVLNLGVHGYGTDQQYLRLREEGLPRQPDLVILGFYLPNVERNGLGFRDYAKPVFRLSSAGQYELAGVPVPSKRELTVEAVPFWHCRLTGLLRVQGGRLSRKLSDPDGDEHPDLLVTQEILARVDAACRERKVPWLLVLIPKRLEPVPRVEETVLLAWAAERGVAVVNMRPPLWALSEADRLRQYDHGEVGHWTAEAHDRCAAELLAPVKRLLAERAAAVLRR